MNNFSIIFICYDILQMKKEFPPAFEGLLQGMQEFAQSISKELPSEN